MIYSRVSAVMSFRSSVKLCMGLGETASNFRTDYVQIPNERKANHQGLSPVAGVILNWFPDSAVQIWKSKRINSSSS